MMENTDFRIWGYCRISTEKQNIDRQVRIIKKHYPAAIIKCEVYTGRKFQGRKILESILKVAKPGDWIVFESVSRMSRNAEEGWKLYEELYNKGIVLVFIKEPHINTAVYKEQMQRMIDIYINTGDGPTDILLNSIIDALNKFVLNLAKQQVQLAFEQSEKEVSDLRQRTREGVETARLNGKQIGQKEGAKLLVKKEAPAKSIILRHSKTFGNGNLNDDECIKLANVSRNTYYKYKRELKVLTKGEGVK